MAQPRKLQAIHPGELFRSPLPATEACLDSPLTRHFCRGFGQ